MYRRHGGDGFRVHFFQVKNQYEADEPIFIMDYNVLLSSCHEEPRGVGVHPHRGLRLQFIRKCGPS